MDGLDLPAPYPARIASLRRLIDDLRFEIDLFAGLVRGRMAKKPEYAAAQSLPGIGPTLAAVLIAEIGDVIRFRVGLETDLLGRADTQALRVRHPRPPWLDHQTGLPSGPLGGNRVRQTIPKGSPVGVLRERAK